MNTRLPAIDPATATGKAKELLDGVQAKLGTVPNLMRTMAQSPAVLEAYLNFSSTLGKGLLSVKLREQIALTVAEANTCEYCLSAHSALGKIAGLSEQEVLDSRQGKSSDSRAAAALLFARTVVNQRGLVSDDEVTGLRQAGFGDGEIAEIVAHVALNLFTNYFNHVAGTVVDFPKVPVVAAA